MADRFFVMPDEGLAPLLAPLQAARQTIDIYVFTLSNDAILAALRAAVARGVAVRAVVDPHPSDNAAAGAAATAALTAAGVAVRPTPPYFDRVHAKSYIVDSALALVSSMNYLNDWAQTRDYGLLTAHPTVVAGIAAAFAADWAAQPLPGVPPAPLVLSPANSRAVLEELIAGAQQTLLLQEEQITDAAMVAALAARSRAGVAVRLLSNAGQHKNAQPLAELQAQAPAADIRYDTRRWLHAKLVIADGARMLLGSVNITPLSLDRRREVSVLVDDPAIVARAVAVAEADFAAGSATPPPQHKLPPRPSDSPGG